MVVLAAAEEPKPANDEAAGAALLGCTPKPAAAGAASVSQHHVQRLITHVIEAHAGRCSTHACMA